METRAYRLQMRAPLHVGEQGIGNEQTLAYIPSDTLFSALVVTWSTVPGLQDTVAALVDPNAAPPLLLTSAFPYAGDVRLLPRPALPHTPTLSDKETAKTVKRIAWVSESVFAALIGGIDETALNTHWSQKTLLQAGAAWTTAEEGNRLQAQLPQNDAGEHLIWWTDIVPRVTVDRVTNASQIYHVGRTFFADSCGLWFAARGESNWLDRMEQVLDLKAVEGIGGLRSVGNGQFTLHKDVAPSFLTDAMTNAGNAQGELLLSRLAPSSGEMARLRADCASYQLVLVGGFSGTPGTNPVVRRQVRMVTEGSVIGAAVASSRPPGQLVDVTPERTPWLGHRIYRYGYGFTVPVRLDGQGGQG
jgi:CRISPR-associated protein Csm4